MAPILNVQEEWDRLLPPSPASLSPSCCSGFSQWRRTHFNVYPKTPKNLLTAEGELGRGPRHCKEDLSAWLLGQAVPWETATGFPRILPCSVWGGHGSLPESDLVICSLPILHSQSQLYWAILPGLHLASIEPPSHRGGEQWLESGVRFTRVCTVKC